MTPIFDFKNERMIFMQQQTGFTVTTKKVYTVTAFDSTTQKSSSLNFAADSISAAETMALKMVGTTETITSISTNSTIVTDVAAVTP